MINTIKINDSQSVELDSSMNWLFIYRKYFGKDILPDIMPLLEAAISTLVKLTGGDNPESEEISMENVLKNIDDDVMQSLFLNLSMLETTTILQVMWAMIKNADDKVEPVEKWLKGYDNLPLDEIIPQLFGMTLKASVSSKNLQRLQNLKGKAQTATQSTLKNVL